MDTGTDTKLRHKAFLKNYNMIRHIGHRYDTDTAQVRHSK